MSWLKNVFPPKIKKIVGSAKKSVPDGVWHKCLSCKTALYNSDLEKIAKKSFFALSAKSFGRIDIKMDHLGRAHFMEANLMPGLRKGYFYRSCKLNLNINYDQMILNIANTGLTSNIRSH